MKPYKSAVLVTAFCIGAGFAFPDSARATVTIYSQGFETDTAGWDAFGGTFDATRVASGTNGITSATGGFHAETNPPTTAASNMGGYSFGTSGVPFPVGGFTTSVDIYLDVANPLWANDTRFDFSAAASKSDGSFLRDFVFNLGFYDDLDLTGPGAGTDRFVISASNNSGRANSFPKNPGRAPIAISTSGWYTFQHEFYDNGGALAVDLSILDSSESLVNSWTLSDPSDLIPGVAGGNRYNWFVNNEFSVLAFDNSKLTIVPEPSRALLSLAGVATVAMRRRRKD